MPNLYIATFGRKAVPGDKSIARFGYEAISRQLTVGQNLAMTDVGAGFRVAPVGYKDRLAAFYAAKTGHSLGGNIAI